MKKFLAIILSLVLIFTAVSCGGDTPDTSSVDTKSEETSTSSVEETVSQTASSEETSSEEVFENVEVDHSVSILDKDLKNTKRIKILPLGDSFTEIEPSAYRFYLYEMLYKNGNFFEYVGGFSTNDKRLGDAYNNHMGKSGDTCVQGLELYNQYIAGKTNYDVMILFYGINDYAHYSVDEFKTHYTTLLNRAYEDNPKAIIYCIGTPREETAVVIEAVANEFKAKGKETYYINMFQREDVVFDKYEDYIIQTASKGHLCDNGNRKFAGVIFNEIKDRMTQLNAEKPNYPSSVPSAVTKLTLSKTSLNLKIDEQSTLSYTIAPANADTQSVKWFNSNPKVATVNEYGVVTATGAGEADITAVSLDGKVSAVCKVSVSDEKFEIPTNATERVFKDKFNDIELWNEESYLYITEPKTYNVSFTWSNENVSVSTKEAYDLGTDFNYSFNYSTNAVDADESRNCSVSIGKYKLAIADSASKVILYVGNKEVGRYEGDYRFYQFDLYTVSVMNGTAYVLRNNEILFTANVGATAASGKFVIDWKHRWSVGVVDNLDVNKK